MEFACMEPTRHDMTQPSKDDTDRRTADGGGWSSSFFFVLPFPLCERGSFLEQPCAIQPCVCVCVCTWMTRTYLRPTLQTRQGPATHFSPSEGASPRPFFLSIMAHTAFGWQTSQKQVKASSAVPWLARPSNGVEQARGEGKGKTHRLRYQRGARRTAARTGAGVALVLWCSGALVRWCAGALVLGNRAPVLSA